MKYLPWILLVGALMATGWLLWLRPVDTQIGVLNMGLIIEESPRAQELNRQLSERYNQLVEEIREDQDSDDEEQAQREREAYSEYLRFRQELEDQFQADLDRVVRQVAKNQRLQLVLDEDVVRYGAVDISQEIISRLR